MEHKHSLDKELVFAIRDENKPKFINLMRRPILLLQQKKNKKNDKHSNLGINMLMCQVWQLICLHSSIECARAMIEEFRVSPHKPLQDGYTPFQYAARSLFYDLVQLFLDDAWQRRGTLNRNSVDDNYDKYYSSHELAMHPLSLALEAVSHDPDLNGWAPSKSIFKLIYILCIRDLYESVETIRLLALNTDAKLVEKIGLRCVEQGKVVQLTALLIATWDILMANKAKGSDDSRIEQRIVKELTTPYDEVLYNATQREYLKSKKINLTHALNAFDILEQTHDSIDDFRTSESMLGEKIPNYAVPFDLGYQFSNVFGFDLNPFDIWSDDVPCLALKLKPDEKARFDEAIEREIRSGSVFIPPRSITPWTTSPRARPFQTCVASTLKFNYLKGQLPRWPFKFRPSAKIAELPGTTHVLKPFNFRPSAKIASSLLLFARNAIR